MTDGFGIRTLVVDAEPEARRLLTGILRSRGHQVDACADAESGWSSYQREPTDLILMDLRLPGMDGVDLCRRIRRLPDSGETVILFVTGVEERMELEEALDAGADDYIRKPIGDQQIHIRLAIVERRIRDGRARREMEAHLQQDALHDRLTGLANRSFIRERINHCARRSIRHEQYHYAVFALDICDFAAVNRRYGQAIGDPLLAEVAGRLENSVRSIDAVARLTADRFAILLDGLNDVSDPTRVASRINQNLSRPFILNGETIQVAACIGIALSASGYQEADEILRDAHSALDQAKKEGPGTYRIYDPVLHAKAMARVELESRIRAALKDDAMELAYQPIVQLDTGQIVGFEALLRWQDGARGQVPPEDFIPVAEQSGLILAIGSWVLDQVVEQLREWTQLAAEERPFFVSVNISGKQFQQTDLPAEIRQRLAPAELSGSLLHVEMTETVLMENVEAVTRSLSGLRDQSIQIQIDDFGTGYSSLSYLCRFPIDTLKIDRSFVNQMQHSPENMEVVRAIVRLGHNLGMTILAEGVETETQLETLRDLGCDLGQGFLFSRPVTGQSVPGLWQGPPLASG